jgi:hypothetical protein
MIVVLIKVYRFILQELPAAFTNVPSAAFLRAEAEMGDVSWGQKPTAYGNSGRFFVNPAPLPC